MAHGTLISMIGGYRLTLLQQVVCVTKQLDVFGRENNDGTRHIGLETWLSVKM